MKTVSLGEVAKIERHTVDPATLEPSTKYIGLEHIERGGRLLGHSTVEEAELASTKFRFSPEHILYGKLRPNLGKISRPEYAGVCSTDILPVRPSKDLDRNFLAHYLAQPHMIDFAANLASGANLPRLSPAALETFPIPLPSIREQRRIAAVLDQADALRAKRRQALAHLDTLTQSIFHDMFGAIGASTYKPLSALATVTSGITKGRRTSEPTFATPYLAVSNVQASRLVMNTVKEIPATEAEIERYALADGDLVLTEGGDPDKLGRGTVWRNELPLCLHQNHVFRVRINDSCELLPDFLAGFLSDSRAKSYFLRSAKQTTGIASINMTQLKALPVPVPPLPNQDEYLQRMQGTRHQIGIARRGLASMDNLFSSLQSRAFRGEL